MRTSQTSPGWRRPAASSSRRSRFGIRTGVVLLAVAALSAVGPAASSAATTGPTLSFANAGAQSTLGAAYTMALKNLLVTNTVSYDPSVFNTSGLMTNPPGTRRVIKSSS